MKHQQHHVQRPSSPVGSAASVPDSITMDRGPAFLSELWVSLARLMGTTLHSTTAYNPTENSMVERAHRSLKAALMARCTDERWKEQLPWVLLGPRTAPRANGDASPAESVYGETLAIPGEFFPPPTPLSQGLGNLHRSSHPATRPSSTEPSPTAHPPYTSAPTFSIYKDSSTPGPSDGAVLAQMTTSAPTLEIEISPNVDNFSKNKLTNSINNKHPDPPPDFPSPGPSSHSSLMMTSSKDTDFFRKSSSKN
ncbi:uncharacterized protein [Macrobrachium rosenbergii]|uniref:uncharacterized protein n=1 Tax=Macrobrachium rosenbergii TaxID=79674 RepID=UPI0034D5F66E